MEEHHREILRQHRVLLRRELSADRVASDLYSAKVFDEEDLSEVGACRTAQKQAEKLLDILIHRGPHAFRCFYESLQKTSRHIADQIYSPYTEMASQNGSLKAAGLPCFPVNFIGRNELRSEMSNKIKQGLRLLTIIGAPGCGKSTLAVVLGHMLQDEGLLVLYFILKDITTVYGASVLILETLNQVVSRDPITQLLQFLRFELKTTTLLILDNTEDLQVNESKKFSQFLENVGKFSTNIHTLVTTTQAILGSTLQLLPFHAQSIPLEPLNDEESRMLWKKYSHGNTEGKHTAVRELCKACMGMPLFLEVAASQIRHGNDIESLLQDLKSSPDVLLQEDDIAVKMKIFLSRLPGDLKTTLATLAVFPASFSSAEAVVLFPDWKNVTLYQKLIKLQDYSLLKFDSEGMTYKIHNVVQSVVTRATLDDFIYQEYNKAVVTFVHFYLERLQQMNVLFISHANKDALQMYADNKRNILHAFTLAIEYKLREAVDVSTEVVNLLAKCMNIKEFETVYEGLANIAKEDAKCYSDCLTSLGFKLLYYNGKESSYDRAQHVLTEAYNLQQLPMDTEERAHCLSKLGLCLARAGQHQRGVHLIVKGILIRKKLFARDRGDIKEMLVSGGFCDLAMALSPFSIKAALKIWEDICLKTYKRILNTHPFTATLLQYIGDAYHQLGQYQQAAEQKRNAYDMRKNLLTRYHQDTARSLFSLAKTLATLGQSEEAVYMLKETLQIQAKVQASPADIQCTKQHIEQIENQMDQHNIHHAFESFSIADAL